MADTLTGETIETVVSVPLSRYGHCAICDHQPAAYFVNLDSLGVDDWQPMCPACAAEACWQGFVEMLRIGWEMDGLIDDMLALAQGGTDEQGSEEDVGESPEGGSSVQGEVRVTSRTG